MKATFYAKSFGFIENNVFLLKNFTDNIKNYAFMFIELRKQLATHGIELSTHDINPPEESGLIIALDDFVFFQTYQRRPGQLIYLFLNEPANYYPELWKRENHGVFDRVFTYDYTLADNCKYIHHYFAVDLDNYPAFAEVTEADFRQRKLLVLVAGMFQLAPPPKGSSSLLYVRYRTMRWFSKHLPEEFSFFGRGLEPHFYESFRGAGVMRKILPATLAKRLVSSVAAKRRKAVEAIYKGPILHSDKLSVLREYRFVICYENSSLPGYVSEKLFDCFFAGSVPVYLGEPDIQRFIPAGCYIDRNTFASDAALAQFLQQMTYNEYSRYTKAIQRFVEGLEYEKFGSQANARRVADVIMRDLADPARLETL